MGISRLQHSCQRAAANTTGHDHISDQQVDVDRAPFPNRQRFRAVSGLEHSVTSALQRQPGRFPHDPFVLAPRHSHLSVISANQISYRVDRFGSLRGVNGWYSAACVVNGDESAPGTPDDRVEVMTPLVPLSEEVMPYALTIMPEYL